MVGGRIAEEPGTTGNSLVKVGRGSVVGIATRSFGLDGPGIESRLGRSFPHLSVWPWVPPSLLYSGYRLSSLRVKRSGRGFDYPSSPRLKKE